MARRATSAFLRFFDKEKQKITNKMEKEKIFQKKGKNIRKKT